MINIVCVRAGSKYPARYVEILANMVGRCMPPDVPFRLVCFTDQPEEIKNVNLRYLPKGVHGWWAKLAMFRSGAFTWGERIIYFDLDTVLVGLLTDFVAYDGDFAILRDVYRPDGLQSSVMAWKAGAVDHIWDGWIAAGCPEVEGGDQIWIEKALKIKPDILQKKYPGQFVSYKVDCLSGPPADARVVFFHGWPKPDEITTGWVSQFWKVGGLSPLDLQLVCNTGTDELERNVRDSLRRDIPTLPAVTPVHEGTMCIVGGGPSAKNFIDELKVRQQNGHVIWAVNGSAHWLKSRGVNPDGVWIVDARKENIGFVEPSYAATYYLASQVNPALFDKLVNRDVVVWHTEKSAQWLPAGVSMVGVGSTIGMKAIGGAYALGYRQIHLYGFDSSYDDESHHAYPQSQNDGEAVFEAVAAEKTFRAAAWMIQQVQEFQCMAPELARVGVSIYVHGYGLLPHVAAHLEQLIPAYLKRARAVLSRLPEGPVKGAEIGVFTGAMSRCLLQRHDLSLLMVDSWEPGGASYSHPDGTGDWHTTLSQADQDRFRQAAEAEAAFAGKRATILSKRSCEAACDVQDGSLDFVFIDADHSYEGCRADIDAWLPKLKSDGLLSGHDYDNKEFPKFGVKRAVDEISSRLGLKIELDENFTWFIRLSAALRENAA